MRGHMEKISLWVKFCSVCAVVSAVFIAIVPECKLKNAYKTLCALIMLVAFFSVFTTADKSGFNSFDLNRDNSSEISKKTEELLVTEGEKMMDRFIENKLYSENIEAVCKSEMQFIDDRLKISRIYLYGSFSEEEKDRAKRIIGQCLEEECEVIFAKRNE